MIKKKYGKGRNQSMAGIVFDTRRVKVYEDLKALCEYTGESIEWCDQLWEALILDDSLFKEFVYYLENHMLTENLKCEGYSLIDLYVWQMNLDNLIHDTGKNTVDCNKEKMILHTFQMMSQMKKDPKTFIKRLNEGRGMDKLG